MLPVSFYFDFDDDEFHFDEDRLGKAPWEENAIEHVDEPRANPDDPTACHHCGRNWFDEYLERSPWEQTALLEQYPHAKPALFRRGICPLCKNQYGYLSIMAQRPRGVRRKKRRHPYDWSHEADDDILDILKEWHRRHRQQVLRFLYDSADWETD